MTTHATLDVAVYARYEVRNGVVVTRGREEPYSLYGAPVPSGADAFIWPESNGRFVVALRRESRGYYGCFHVLPTLDAAKMFVMHTCN